MKNWKKFPLLVVAVLMIASATACSSSTHRNNSGNAYKNSFSLSTGFAEKIKTLDQTLVMQRESYMLVKANSRRTDTCG